MTNSRGRGGDGELAALIRDQLRDASNRQFLSRLPVFRADNDGEDVFGDLLQRLDRAETKRARH
jgi:hypothetical protein